MGLEDERGNARNVRGGGHAGSRGLGVVVVYRGGAHAGSAGARGGYDVNAGGATTSGLSLPSAVGPPLLEKLAMLSLLSTAPTVMTLLAAAGEPTV